MTLETKPLRKLMDLRRKIPCSAAGAEAFCREFRPWHQEACGGRDAYASELLLREALANSVRHSGWDRREIACVLRGNDRRLLIAVRDGGPGFDWRTQLAICCGTGLNTSGRGLPIYLRYAQQLRFNGSGNGVTLLRRFAVRAQEGFPPQAAAGQETARGGARRETGRTAKAKEKERAK